MRADFGSTARSVAAACIVLTAVAAALAVQAQSATGTPAQPTAVDAAAASPDAGAPKAPPAPAPIPAAFRTLTPQQQKALAPLAKDWGGMGETQRRKWLEMVRNFHTMPPTEQERMHGRMVEWTSLSYEQRTQARMNFAEASKLDAGQKKAQWEAYQALSPEERSRLTEGHAPVPTGVARAVRPVPPQRLATLPPAVTPRPRPTIGVSASQFDQKTLLPQNIAAPAAARNPTAPAPVPPAPAPVAAQAPDRSPMPPPAPVPAETPAAP